MDAFQHMWDRAARGGRVWCWPMPGEGSRQRPPPNRCFMTRATRSNSALCGFSKRSQPLSGRHDGQVTFAFETATQTLPNDTARPLALILNELLANAVTHDLGGRSKATVVSRLAGTDEELVLSVADDAPGFDFVEHEPVRPDLGLSRDWPPARRKA
jgi:hypothetical protein